MGELKRLVEHKPAFDGPCVKCGEAVTVSEYALECAKLANRYLKRKGEESLIRRSELAMCGDCYAKRYAAMWAREMKVSGVIEKMWHAFKSQWRMNDGQREKQATVDAFLQEAGVYGYAESYEPLVYRWIKAEKNGDHKRTADRGSKRKGAGFSK